MPGGARSATREEDPMLATPETQDGLPDMEVSARQVFGIDSDLEVPAYSQPEEHVPDLDPDYIFDRETTLAILAGFARNRRVMITGYHGTGKSTHVEQVASRLNWPCVRINLDSHVSRIDLVGKDAIVLQDGKQVTEFKDGILPWALQNNIALCFDEYDAGRPDVMFVIQRVLELSGKLTLLDQRRVIRPHPAFRLFSTANTVASATPPAFITAHSRSTRARWTAGRSSRRSTTCRTTSRSISSCPRRRTTARTRDATSSTRWCGSPTSRATPSSTVTCRPSCRRVPSSPGPRTPTSSATSASPFGS